tara:strand:- start:356 stop:670 length:315 start_codon:yes stop_codon:yes gene_type:complete
MINELKEDTLQKSIHNHSNVIVQYSASWCGNCRIMKPKLKKISQDYMDIHFIIIDAEKNPISRQLANVNNLPTFAFFHNGILKKQVQTNKFEVLKSFVHEASDY